MKIQLSTDFANQKINKKDIENFEKEINSKLPDDYKSFMLEYNGGIIINDSNAIYIQEDDPYGIDEFLDLDNVLLQTKLRIKPEQFGGKYLVIARDAGEYHYLLCLENTNFGYIYVFGGCEEFEQIATSFTEFLNKIEEF